MQVTSTTDIYGNSIGAVKEPVKSLDREAFLQLFVEQLKNQDPTNPQDSSSMINQMAQFSILEQLTNIGEDVAKIKLTQNIGEASTLLGKQVKVQAEDGEVTGQVEKVTITGEEVLIFINGTGYGMDQLTEIN